MIIKKDDFQRKDNLDPIAWNIQKIFRTAANDILQNDDRKHVLQVITRTMSFVSQLLQPLANKEEAS